MNMLDKIYESYIENKMDAPDPDNVMAAYNEYVSALDDLKIEDIKTRGMLWDAFASYSMESEKNGFMAGFKMALELVGTVKRGAGC